MELRNNCYGTVIFYDQKLPGDNNTSVFRFDLKNQLVSKALYQLTPNVLHNSCSTVESLVIRIYILHQQYYEDLGTAFKDKTIACIYFWKEKKNFFFFFSKWLCSMWHIILELFHILQYMWHNCQGHNNNNHLNIPEKVWIKYENKLFCKLGLLLGKLRTLFWENENSE